MFFVHVDQKRYVKHSENSNFFSKSRFRKKNALKKKLRKKRIFFMAESQPNLTNLDEAGRKRFRLNLVELQLN